MPLEMLQRNLMLGCQEPQVFAILKYVIDPMILSRVQNSISSFINSHCTTVSSFMGTCQPPVVQPDALPHTTANREGSALLANVLNWIDRSFNHSVLQPFVRAVTTSRYLPLHNEYMQRILSSLLSSLLPNSLYAKLSISVTVVPNDTSVNMDQFTSGLMVKHVTYRHQGGIFGLLRLPPVDTVSSAPLTVIWTVTIQSPNLLQAVSYTKAHVILVSPKFHFPYRILMLFSLLIQWRLSIKTTGKTLLLSSNLHTVTMKKNQMIILLETLIIVLRVRPQTQVIGTKQTGWTYSVIFQQKIHHT